MANNVACKKNITSPPDVIYSYRNNAELLKPASFFIERLEDGSHPNVILLILALTKHESLYGFDLGHLW